MDYSVQFYVGRESEEERERIRLVGIRETMFWVCGIELVLRLLAIDVLSLLVQ